MHQGRRFAMWAIGLLVALAVMFVVHLGTGFSEFSYMDLVRIIAGYGSEWQERVVFDFRMVRSVLAICIGAGLALSGAIFQTITRNELASPSVLGVNAGAGVAVMLYIYFEPANAITTIWKAPVFAIIGGGLAALLIFRMSYRKGRSLSPMTLILNGIALSAGIHAVQMVTMVTLSPDKFNQINTWLIGTIFGNSWNHVMVLAPIVAVGAIVLYCYSTKLNVLNLNEETAIGLGARITKERVTFLCIAVAIASSCIAVGGSIGFIGLVAPHIARRLVGVNHHYYLPVTLLLGALLLLSADWLGQVIIAPDEMLVGIIVALVGAPYFLYVLARTLQRESQQDRDLIDWAIDVTDLHNFAHTPIQNLSGGQRQRAWIAMAIAQDTDILFLDEPTSYLDISHQMDVLELVERLNQEYKKTVIMEFLGWTPSF